MDELLRQVIGVYVVEVQEQVQGISTALLQSESEPRALPLHMEELFRQAHNLKGSSASLGIGELEQLAHAVESALSAVRRGRQPLSRELVDAGLAAADAARKRIPGLLAESDSGLLDVTAATDRLLQLAAAADAATESALDAVLDAATKPPEPAASAAVQAEPLLASEAADFVRISVSRLEKLEREAADLRVLSGRLGRYSQEVANCLHYSDDLWQLFRKQADSALPIPGMTPVSERPQPLYQLVRGLRTLRRELNNDAEILVSAAGRQEDELRSMRLVSAALILEPLQRAGREACRATEREAQIILQEEQVYIDRALLEDLKNPLMHLIRNAVDHGIEPPEVREAVGKPHRGTITVRLQQSGEVLRITVEDDGRGIDLERVREKAVSRRVVSAEQAVELDEPALYALLFTPGFSTADTVTELSGRGVGLDVVQRAVSRLHGQVAITSTLGSGAQVEIVVPLTVAASSMLIIREGDHTLALPQSCVESIVLLPLTQLIRVGSRLLYRQAEKTCTVALLRSLLGLKAERTTLPRLPLLLLRSSGAAVGLLCSQLLGSEELILRPLPPELRDHRLLSGVALSPDGGALFVLSPAFLMQEARSTLPQLFPAAPAAPQAPAPPPTVVIADDSITTRTLLRSVLEADGYAVRTAADGDEALQVLRGEPVDLVVSDVRMPRLDGLGLLAKMRSEPRMQAIPVVLFSSLDSDEEKRRGESAGAAAYLSKSAFDRGQLFAVVSRLLGRSS